MGCDLNHFGASGCCAQAYKRSGGDSIDSVFWLGEMNKLIEFLALGSGLEIRKLLG
jgi:hypothetical protein